MYSTTPINQQTRQSEQSPVPKPQRSELTVYDSLAPPHFSQQQAHQLRKSPRGSFMQSGGARGNSTNEVVPKSKLSRRSVLINEGIDIATLDEGSKNRQSPQDNVTSRAVAHQIEQSSTPDEVNYETYKQEIDARMMLGDLESSDPKYSPKKQTTTEYESKTIKSQPYVINEPKKASPQASTKKFSPQKIVNPVRSSTTQTIKPYEKGHNVLPVKILDELQKQKDHTIRLNIENQQLYDDKMTLETRVSNRDAQVQELYLENEAIRKVKITTQQCMMDGNVAHRKLQEITKNQDSIINEYDLRLKRERDQRDILVNDKNKVIKRLDQVEKRLKDFQLQNDRLRNSLNQQTDLNLQISNLTKSNGELKQHRDAVLAQNRLMKVQLQEARARVETETRETANRMKESKQRLEKVLQEKSKCESRIHSLEIDLFQKEFSLKELLLLKEEYILKIKSLEERLGDDTYMHITSKKMRERMEKLEKENESLKTELRKLRARLAEFEKKNWDYSERIRLLLLELEKYRRVPAAPAPAPAPVVVKTDKFYVAVLGDDIDIALAEFINAQTPEKQAKCIFFRQGRGVYYYGTKRVMIKLEQGHLIVRVGGGYREINEFVDEYGDLEEARLDRRGSSSNLKGSMQKVPTLEAVPILQVLADSGKSPRAKSASLKRMTVY